MLMCSNCEDLEKRKETKPLYFEVAAEATPLSEMAQYSQCKENQQDDCVTET